MTAQIHTLPVTQEPKPPTPFVQLSAREAVDLIRTAAQRAVYRGGVMSTDEARRILEVLPTIERTIR